MQTCPLAVYIAFITVIRVLTYRQWESLNIFCIETVRLAKANTTFYTKDYLITTGSTAMTFAMNCFTKYAILHGKIKTISTLLGL